MSIIYNPCKITFSSSSSLSLSLSLSLENSDLHPSYFAAFVYSEALDSNCCFVLKMYFSLPQLFVFLVDVLSVAVFVMGQRSFNTTDL